MSYSCDCSADINECNRCNSVAIRKARKQHVCCECNEPIKPGQRYEDSTGIDHNGYPYQFRTCIGCANIRKKYCPSGWYWGFLAEHIMDCLGFDYRTPPSEIECDEDDGPSLYPEMSEATA